MIKSTILLALIATTLCQDMSSQATITLKPGSEGHDVYLRSLSPNANMGDHSDLMAHSWTNSGEDVIVRALIKFDLSSLPTDIIISDARLSLFAVQSNSNGTHSTLSGSNESRLLLVTEPWDEQTVTWGSQPDSDIEQYIALPETQFSDEDYTDIDITSFVELWVEDPDENHGFLFKLDNEEFYRRMIFGSSDNSNPAKHPELEITYEMSTGISEEAEDVVPFFISSNPINDQVSVQSSEGNMIDLQIFDYYGRILLVEQIAPHSSITIDSSDWSAGLYLFNSGKSSLKVLKE